jgi:hypothetical protein
MSAVYVDRLLSLLLVSAVLNPGTDDLKAEEQPNLMEYIDTNIGQGA